jgi:hypothetical protein
MQSVTILVLRVCPGADNQGPLPTTIKSTQKSHINVGIKYKIPHTGPSSAAVVTSHHGQPGGIHLPAKVSMLCHGLLSLGKFRSRGTPSSLQSRSAQLSVGRLPLPLHAGTHNSTQLLLMPTHIAPNSTAISSPPPPCPRPPSLISLPPGLWLRAATPPPLPGRPPPPSLASVPTAWKIFFRMILPCSQHYRNTRSMLSPALVQLALEFAAPPKLSSKPSGRPQRTQRPRQLRKENSS